MFIIGIGTAVPPHRYLQSECWEAASNSPQFSQLAPRSRALLKKVFLAQNGVASRHLALDKLADIFDITPDAMHARFAKHAPALATEAAFNALRHAGVNPAEIDGVIISTCTGYLCPGLTSYVAERLGLKSAVLALDLVGQGCGAALPNVRTAQGLIDSGQCRHVLSICVEICSAAFYLDDDPGVLISACIFGDAAGAVLLSPESRPGFRRIEWKTAASMLSPADRDALRFDHRHGLLRNILTLHVPELAARSADALLKHVLSSQHLTPSHIAAWLWHAGGRDVLLALQKRLNLRDTDLRWSASVLKDFGNVSSPFVMHVLKAALDGQAPGGWWWMSSFGAGFSCHGALLNVEELS